jgi:hypothetical protein
MLILRMRRVYDACRRDDFRGHDIRTISFMTIGSGIQVILKMFRQ